jgi:hypothetical protein
MTAKVKIPLLKSAMFYNKVADVLGLFGTGGLITLNETNADDKWTWIVGAASITVQVIRMLFVDSNHNNIPDILEDQEADIQQEVTVTVKQGADGTPPIVDVVQNTVQVEKDKEK